MTAGGDPRNPERWRRIRRVFRDALDLPGVERGAFLDRACADDPALRAEVESLLAADEAAGDFLGTPAAKLGASLPDPGPAVEPAAGTRIAQYRVIREIGRGGAGVVYLAERADGHFDQKVALKLIRADRAGEDIARRFSQERQILAGLHHPHVARLLDGGVTEDGRHYFAMEFVDGTPITRYADGQRLTTAARARLFEDVCDAVRYAQERLVVHRDLKPSNILVTGNGQVKLLDFGIARLVGPGDDAELTRDGAVLLTPEYAAPEQVRGETITTATDVFALGGVLFELLSGRKPHPGGTLGAIERTLAGREPDSLARALARAPAAGEVPLDEAADARNTTAARLRGSLRGDLENIVARAMRVRPDERYPTAGAMLDDLRRWRTGLPVAARAPSPAYRARKFLRRHRLAVAAAAALLVVGMAGVAGVLWQARVARHEAAVATAAKDFLVRVFTERDPARSGGDDPTASEILERGAERVDDELAAQPELRAEMLHVIGAVQHGLGNLEEAAPLLERALALREATLDATHPDVRRSLAALAAVETQRSRLARAESLLTRALALERESGAGASAGLAADFAAVLRQQGRLAEAEKHYLRAIALNRAEHGDLHPEVARGLDNLSVLLTDAGRLEEAETAAREALDIRRRAFPDEHPDVHLSLHNLGWILMTRGQLDEAEELLRDVVARRRALYDEPHPLLANSLQLLGTLLRTRGDLDGAEAACREALDVARAVFGDEAHPVALAHNDLGVLAYHRGDFQASREHFARSLAAFRSFLDEGHPTVLTLRSNLAALGERLGDFAAAETAYREILAARIAALGPDHPDVGMGHRSVGTALTSQGDAEGAVASLRASLDVYVRALGEGHEEVAVTRTYLAGALSAAGRDREAAEQAEMALAALDSLFEGEHRKKTDARAALGRALDSQGRSAEAAPLLESVLAHRREDHPADSAPVASAMCYLGGCRLRLGEIDAAAALLPQGHHILAAQWPESHPLVRRASRDLARLLAVRGPASPTAGEP